MKKRPLIRAVAASTIHLIGSGGPILFKSEEHRLVYLPIAKNGNSFIKALFLLNMDKTNEFNPIEQTAMSYLNSISDKDKKSFLIKRKEANQLKGYTKFVVLRDPAERLVSCYLNKFAKPYYRGDRRYIDDFVQDASKRIKKSPCADLLTFHDFVSYVLMTPDYRRDHHYRSQASFISGIQFDLYFDLSDSSSWLNFLEKSGFDTAMKKRNTEIDKKTHYAQGDGEGSNKNFSNMILSDLSSFESYPNFKSFYTKDLLVRFMDKYRKDFNIYLSMKDISEREYLAGWHGLMTSAYKKK